MTDFAWMIERGHGGRPVWWDGREMSPDPNKGVRFARKDDAARVIETHGFQLAEATEHGWMKQRADGKAAELSFEGWRAIIASQPGCQDCIFDGGRLIDHCHNCCLAIIGEVWRRFQGPGDALRDDNANERAAYLEEKKANEQ